MNRLVFLAMVVTTVGCHGPASSLCANGATCAPGLICDDNHSRCLVPGQLEACAGLADGQPCAFAGASGVCDQGVCIGDECGDGIRGIAETCDDGNRLDGDGCAADCQSTEVCGNGLFEPELGEECDCGDGTGGVISCTRLNSDDPGALCRSDCVLHCGDGVVNAAEECDGAPPGDVCVNLGFDRGLIGCTPQCGNDLRPCGHIGWQTDVFPAAGTQIHSIHRAAGGRQTFHAGSLFVTALPVPPYVIWIGIVGHRAGDQWTVRVLSNGRGFDVWAAADDDAYAVTSTGGVSHFDGAEWTVDKDEVSSVLRAVWGSGTEVYAGGAGGLYRRQDGDWVSAWSDGNADIYDIAGTAVDDIFAIGSKDAARIALHYDGSAWSPAESGLGPELLRALWVDPEDGSVIAAGDAGTVARFDRELDEWQSLDTGIDDDISAIWSNGDHIIATTSGADRILHYEQGGWHGARTESGGTFASLWGDDITNVIAGGVGEVARYPGSRWDNTGWSPSASVLWTAPDGVWFSIGTDTGEIGRLAPDGPQLEVASENKLRALWGRHATDVFAAGANGTVVHYDGEWSDVSPPDQTVTFDKVYGNNSELWVAGGGVVLARDMSGWVDVSPPEPLTINGLWVSSTGDAWIAATDGSAWRRSAGTWSRVLDTDTPLAAVWGLDDRVWVGGTGPDIWRYENGTWSADNARLPIGVREIRGTGPDDIFAYGPFGGISHNQGNGWAPVRRPGKIAARAFSVTPGVVDVGTPTGIQRLWRTAPW